MGFQIPRHGPIYDSLEVMLGTILRILWWIATLPFRLLVGTVKLLGRATAFVLGFVLMVVGVALCAGPLFLIGIPVFVVGLLLTLRALD